MMFQTSGLNTGSVRLDTGILGFCCASDAVASNDTNAQAAASVARLRRENMAMKSLPLNVNLLFSLHVSVRVAMQQAQIVPNVARSAADQKSGLVASGIGN